MSFIIFFVTIFACIHAKITIYLTDTPIEKIGTRFYRKELLTNEYDSPKELAYDSSSRNLFFMYMDNYLQNSRRAYINIITKETRKIDGIARNKATAIDLDNGSVYFGSDNGLYKYDPINNTARNIGLYNMNIYKLVIRDNDMYIIDGNDHQIYKIYDEGRIAIKFGNANTVMQFDLDNQKNVHFVTMCGVFCAYNRQDIIKNKDINIVYQFFVEDNKTFGLTDDGIYDIDCFNGTARKVANIDFYPSSMIFGDYGDIFYSIDNDIYRLRPISSYHVYNIRKKTHN